MRRHHNISSSRQRAQPEDVRLPRSEIDIEAVVAHVASIAIVDVAGHSIVEAPLPVSQIVPRQVHAPLRGRGPVVHDNQRALAVFHPAPGEQVLEALAQDVSLAEMLDLFARTIERQSSDMLCSILLLDGNKLRHGAAPSLPDGRATRSARTGASHRREIDPDSSLSAAVRRRPPDPDRPALPDGGRGRPAALSANPRTGPREAAGPRAA